MKHFLLSVAVLVVFFTQAQNVGVGTTTPAAKLDISSTNSGILIPRVVLTGTATASPVTSPVVSMMVYNTATAGAGATAVSPGYYYWSGAAWVRLLDNVAASNNIYNTDGTLTGTRTVTMGANNLSFNSTSGNFIINPSTTGAVGIGTAAPTASLHVAGTNGFLATGTVGTGAIPTTGAGARMMWYPNKSAFRVGSASNTQWDDVNIGNSSIAMGANPTASGVTSIAIGNNVISGGAFSTAIGVSANSSGSVSTAIGPSANASGNASMAIGNNVGARSYAEVAMGVNNTFNAGSSTTTWVATDRLFGIGNGNLSPSDAMVILKNGNTGFGTATPANKLVVVGKTKTDTLQITGGAASGYVLQSDASGNASWVAPAVTPATTNTLSNPVNTITSTVNGVAVTAPAVNTVSNTSSGNTLGTTINGVAGATVPIVNSISNTSSANTISTTVNGVAGATSTIINSSTAGWTQAGGLSDTINGVRTNITPASGTVTNVLGYNATGIPVYTAAAAVLSGATTNTLSNPVNTITSTVNGVAVTAPAVNTNVLSQNGTNQLVSTVNGVVSSAQTLSVTGDVTGNLGASTVNKINGTSMAGLGTGILKNTTGTGVPSIAVAADFPTLNQSTTGNAATATNFTGSLAGDVTGTQGATVVGAVGGSTAANLHSGELTANAATSANTASTIVKRDASGNFSAGTITANLTGNATSATSAGSFTGSLTGDVTGTQAATTVGKINGTTMSGLATGILKNTTGTGVPSIAIASDFPVLNQNTTGNAATATTATTVTTNANLTGPITSVGNVTSIASQTGTGSTFAMSASPTFTGTPTLPTGTIGVTQTAGTNNTTLATTAFVAASAATNANLTGPITSVGNATSVAAQTGTGSTFVMNTSPTLITPVIGAATGTSLSVSGQLASTVATGTAPLVVSSTTLVPNLHAATSDLATNSTTATNFTGSLAGDVTGTQGATVVGKINGTSLSGLSTGILKNTTGSGVPSIAVAADFPTLPYVDLTTTQTAAGVKTWSGNANFNGGTVALGNGASNMITYPIAGSALPTFTSSSAGTRLLLYPSESANTVDYAMGIANSTLWHSVPQNTSAYWHSFYGGTSELMRIQGDGKVGIGTTTPALPLDVSTTGAVGATLTVPVANFFAPNNTTANAYTAIRTGNTATNNNSAEFRFTPLATGNVAQIGLFGSATGPVVNSSGNVGINNTAPLATLDVNGSTKTGTFEMTSGAANGYILKSDAAGNASWVNPTSITTGTTNTLTNPVNTITSTVNGVAVTAPAVNTNVLNQNGTNQLVSTVNGVVSSAQTLAVTGDVTGNLGASTVNKINGTSLSGLSTGILKNTTGSGVPSIAIASDFPVLNQNTTGNAATATTATTVTTNANLTGPITSVGNVTSIASQTGTGSTFAMSASPTFTGTPTLPTGTIGVTQTAGTNNTTLATTAFVAASAATNANLTGPITSLGNATSVAAQTGTGSTFVMNTSPTLITPVIGAATGTSLSVSGQLASTVATGTAPLVVSSTTLVPNLHAATSDLATNSTTATNFTGSLAGDVTGTQGATVVGKINGTSLSGLSTGILKNTTGSGVPSIAVAADFPTLPYVDLTTTQTAAGVKTWSGNANFNGGTVALGNGASNMITYPIAGSALPTFTSSSAGTRLLLYPSESANTVDYAMGIANSTLWHSVPQNTSAYWHSFYGGTSELMRIQGDGKVGIGTTTPALPLDVSTTGAVGATLTVPVANFFAPNNTTANAYTAIRTGNTASNNNSAEFRFTPLATGNVAQIGLFGSATGPVVNSAGNVGINNTAPLAALDVNGAILVENHQNTTHAQGLSLEWNKDNNSGISYLLNQKGLAPVGAGGFIFGKVDAANTVTNQLVISDAGAVTIPTLTTAGIVTTTAAGLLSSTATVPVANGGTGSTTQNFVDLTTPQTATGAKTWSSAAVFNGGVGIGVTTPAGQLSNTTVNTFGNDGQGGNGFTLAWATPNQGYAGSFYNALNGAFGNGLAVKTQGVASSNRILDLSTGAQGTAGTSVMVVQGNGNVGISNAAPAYPLDANGVINTSTGFKVAGGTPSTSTYLKGNGANFVAGNIVATDIPSLSATYVDLTNAQTAAGIKTWSSNAIFNGNVGIGAASPTFQLQLGNGNGMRIAGPSASGTGQTAISLGGYGDLGVDAVGVSNGRFVVKESGNVGIGNASPASNLDVYNNTAHSAVVSNFFGPNNTAVSDLTMIRVGVSASLYNSAELRFGYAGAGSTANVVTLGLYGNGNGLSVNAANNVGVNTTTPAYPLDVTGVINASTGFKVAGGAPSTSTYLKGNGATFVAGTIAAADLSAGISGTAGYHAKFTGANTVGNGLIYDNGTAIGIGNAAPAYTLDVTGNSRITTATQGSVYSSLLLNSTTNGGTYTSYEPLQLSNGGYFGGATTGIGFYNSGTTYATGKITSTLNASGSGGRMDFYTMNTSNASTNRMTIDPFGNVGIGTGNPTSALEVTGNVKATGYAAHFGTGGSYSGNQINWSWNGSQLQGWVDNTIQGTFSDRRLKDRIAPIQGSALSRVMALKPSIFYYKKVEGTIFTGSPIQQEGFIADELQAVIPSAVNGDKNGLNIDGKIQPQTVNVIPIVTVLTKAVQEQQKTIEAQQKQLDEQNQKIEQLMKLIEKK